MEFKKQGIFNKKLANRYKNEVLAKGSSENMNELFQKVVKRKLNNKSILKINNIIS
jgi:Zn-dependent oligopeptidase